MQFKKKYSSNYELNSTSMSGVNPEKAHIYTDASLMCLFSTEALRIQCPRKSWNHKDEQISAENRCF